MILEWEKCDDKLGRGQITAELKLMIWIIMLNTLDWHWPLLIIFIDKMFLEKVLGHQFWTMAKMPI